jgi:hypothetical protein
MRRLVLLAATAVAVVGTTPASAAAKGPCGLITPAQASAALGAKVGAPLSATAGLYEECQYAAGAKHLIVLDRKLTQAVFDKSAKKNPGPVVHVSGIGSDAYSVQGGMGLLLWKNGTELTIYVSGAANPLKAEETLGRDAASHL